MTNLWVQLAALVVCAVVLAYVWDDLFTGLDDLDGDVVELPLADGWCEADVLTTLAEIEAL